MTKHRWIECVRVNGRTERIATDAIEHISLLSDGRGVIYTNAGEVIVVRDGAKVMDEWQHPRPAAGGDA